MTIQANFPNVQPSLLLDFANAKQLPPQVTFTRATTAAYYDGSTTAMAEQNLVLNSSLTSSTTNWAGATNVLTLNYGGIAAPDGTFTAIRCQPVLTSSYVEQNVGGFNVGGTKSIWARTVTGTANAVLMNYSGGDPQVCALTTTWQRFTVTVTNSTIYNYFFLVDARSGSHTATDFLIWAPQAENRSTATAYTATTTQAITNYIPVLLTAGGGQPRFDHNPTTSESLGLLIEEQRTNVLQYSANLSVSPWTTSSVSVTASTIIAPDGTLSGNKIIPDATNNVHYIRQLAGSSANYTFSCYFKAAEYTSVVMLGVGANHGGAFNLSSGTVTATYGSASAAISSVGNGWYRCSISLTVSGTDFYIYVDNAGAYTGNGFSGVYAWGGQLEAAAFPTSYIPTTSASATRAEDNAQLSGNNFTSWFNNDEGTIYADTTIVGLQSSAYPAIVALSDADPNVTNLGIGVDTTAATYFSSGWSNGTIQYNINMGSGVVAGTSGKTIVGYAVNNFAASANAGTVGTASSGLIAPFNRFLIGGQATYQPKMNAWYKKVAYYPQRVTNAQLQALTS